jgi:hypothetical protein
MNIVKGPEQGQVWVAAVCQMIDLVYVDHSKCLVFRKRSLLQYQQIFCSCMFIIDTEAIICLSLAVNRVSGTEEGHVWVPPLCQML